MKFYTYKYPPTFSTLSPCPGERLMDILACFHRTRHVHIHHCAYSGYVGRCGREGGEWDASRWAGEYLRRLARRRRLHAVWSVHPNLHGMASSLPTYIPTCLSSSQSSSLPTLPELLCMSINKILLSALQNLRLIFSSEWNWKSAYVWVGLSTIS